MISAHPDDGVRERQTQIERLLTPREAAEFLRLHPVTLRRLSAAGQIPFLRIGSVRRYRVSDLLAMLEGGEK
jgi:excisionase family DNA binding protein